MIKEKNRASDVVFGANFQHLKKQDGRYID